MMCVDSKLALFAMAPDGTSSKNTVCLPTTIHTNLNNRHTKRFFIVTPHSEL
jgi:hypothetical protein